MNKVIKDALDKGKLLRDELDKKKEEAKRFAEENKAAELAVKAALQVEAERYLSYLPDSLAKAVSERKTSFPLLTLESDYNTKFTALVNLLKPKLEEMGLKSEHTSSSHWVQLTYDPDTGYDATYNHLEVIVPEVE